MPRMYIRPLPEVISRAPMGEKTSTHRSEYGQGTSECSGLTAALVRLAALVLRHSLRPVPTPMGITTMYTEGEIASVFFSSPSVKTTSGRVWALSQLLSSKSASILPGAHQRGARVDHRRAVVAAVAPVGVLARTRHLLRLGAAVPLRTLEQSIPCAVAHAHAGEAHSPVVVPNRGELSAVVAFHLVDARQVSLFLRQVEPAVVAVALAQAHAKGPLIHCAEQRLVARARVRALGVGVLAQTHDAIEC
eukprot:scaffold45749_cov60-Phaeocystis_antarctica.AAC.11